MGCGTSQLGMDGKIETPNKIVPIGLVTEKVDKINEKTMKKTEEGNKEQSIRPVSLLKEINQSTEIVSVPVVVGIPFKTSILTSPTLSSAKKSVFERKEFESTPKSGELNLFDDDIIENHESIIAPSKSPVGEFLQTEGESEIPNPVSNSLILSSPSHKINLLQASVEKMEQSSKYLPSLEPVKILNSTKPVVFDNNRFRAANSGIPSAKPFIWETILPKSNIISVAPAVRISTTIPSVLSPEEEALLNEF